VSQKKFQPLDTVYVAAYCSWVKSRDVMLNWRL